MWSPHFWRKRKRAKQGKEILCDEENQKRKRDTHLSFRKCHCQQTDKKNKKLRSKVCQGTENNSFLLEFSLGTELGSLFLCVNVYINKPKLKSPILVLSRLKKKSSNLAKNY